MLRGFGMSPAARRALVMGLALVAVLSVGAPAFAQDRRRRRPVLLLEGDAATITILIKPDKTADFEFVLGRLKEALAKSEKPERKQQAAGWTIYKTSQAVNGNTAYIMIINPVVKGAGVRHQPAHRRGVPGRGAGDLPEVQGLLRRPRHHAADHVHEDGPVGPRRSGTPSRDHRDSSCCWRSRGAPAVRAACRRLRPQPRRSPRAGASAAPPASTSIRRGWSFPVDASRCRPGGRQGRPDGRLRGGDPRPARGARRRRCAGAGESARAGVSTRPPTPMPRATRCTSTSSPRRSPIPTTGRRWCWAGWSATCQPTCW